jgi:hypothetical protein
MAKNPDIFEWFSADEPNPIGKYKQPKPNNHKLDGGGYPEQGIDNDNIMVKGKWPAGTKKKSRMNMKGFGAAERGRKFFEDD